MPNDVVLKIGEQLESQIAQKSLDVPMLPEVAGKVVKLTQDPDSEAADLAKLIQSDQTLAGHVMRVANSAAYSPNNTMVSLQQAITRLGMKLISEIALSASVNSSMFNAPGFENHIVYEIRYSLATGLWAKEVARAGRKNVEAAFLAGLLHDIGRPVAVQSALEAAKSLKLTPTREDILAIEEQFQQAIGVAVVEKWEMPKTVCDSVKYFSRYSEKHGSQIQTMIVFAGAQIAKHFMCEENDKSLCITVDELKDKPVFADLNIYHDEIDSVLEKEESVNSALEAMSA